ncbi:MAG: hypothetical protein WCI18_10975 [Pseudomonadota bacterium]
MNDKSLFPNEFSDDFNSELHLKDILSQLNGYLLEDLPGPKYFTEAIHNWRQFFILSMCSIHTDEFPPLTQCWKELEERFGDSFSDEVFMACCILADFQFGKQNLSLAEKIISDGPEDLRDFGDQIARSRLGVYQILDINNDFLTLQEFFTDKVISVFHKLEEPEKGQICLARVLTAGDHKFLFGETHCWPSENKSQIFNMMLDKMSLYCLEVTKKESESLLSTRYEKFMKISGPYWMSIVGEADYFADVIMPDFYDDINNAY